MYEIAKKAGLAAGFKRSAVGLSTVEAGGSVLLPETRHEVLWNKAGMRIAVAGYDERVVLTKARKGAEA